MPFQVRTRSVWSAPVTPLHAGIEIDAKPFAGEDDIGIRVVEFLQPIADRPGAVGEKLLPARIERLEINRPIDLLDQVVLAWKVTIQQRLGDAEPARQIARASPKSLLGEKFSRLGNELLAAIVRRQPLLLDASTFGRCFPDHDFGVAETSSGGRNRP